MDKDSFLRLVSDTCGDLVSDAHSGIMSCKSYEDATLIAFMPTHQLLGLRRLMLPLAATFAVEGMAESVFDMYLNRLEDIKRCSQKLLR